MYLKSGGSYRKYRVLCYSEIEFIGSQKVNMVKKLSLYMVSGVKEYWIVDLEENHILVYTIHGEMGA